MDPWILDEGVKLARGISGPAEKVGFQVTLGGSVLLKGKSPKDIDLFFIPRSKSSNPNELVGELEKLWGTATKIDLKFEERTRRAVEDQEEEMNIRFNSPPPPPANNRSRGMAAVWADARRTSTVDRQTRPASYLQAGTDFIPETPRTDDEPYPPGNGNLQPGYRYVVRSSSRAVAIVPDTGFDIYGTIPARSDLDHQEEDGSIGQQSPISKKKDAPSKDPFRLALMFMRGEDRIDAFIV